MTTEQMQNVFDRIVVHLRKQNHKSLSEYGYCEYRGIAGRSCAIGALILDEHYSRSLEGESAFCPRVLEALSASGVPVTPRVAYPTDEDDSDEAVQRIAAYQEREREAQFLADMQYIHDEIEVRNWEGWFELKAGEWGLSYQPPALQ